MEDVKQNEQMKSSELSDQTEQSEKNSRWRECIVKGDNYYCETQKTVNTRNINGMLLCCKEKANQA